MKIVITGATGNLGTSVVEALSRDRRVSELVGIARRPPPPPDCAFVPADVTQHDLGELFRGASVVVHLAWMIQPSRQMQLLERVNIEGTRRVLEAAIREKVPSLVVASSVGAYSTAPKSRMVDETWNTEGISSSYYSRQKVAVERMLDRFEVEHRSMRVVRMRPALIFKKQAASEIRRLFLGPLVPKFLFHDGELPLVPNIDQLRFQCVHSRDAGRAFALAALSDVRGAFNVAASPVLTPDVLAKACHARPVPMSAGLLRQSVNAAWHARLTPVDKGWVDLLLNAPLMNTENAQRELGFSPEISSTRALRELLQGLNQGASGTTAPLQPQT